MERVLKVYGPIDGLLFQKPSLNIFFSQIPTHGKKPKPQNIYFCPRHGV
jgi:hypothetical protein